VASRGREEWERIAAELDAAERQHDRVAAEREAAVERDAGRGKLDSTSDWDLEELTGSIAKATVEAVRAGREMRSDRPPWHRTKGGRVGAVIGLLSSLAGLLELLRQAGVFGAP
jgi:hypothetical protein